MIAHNGYAYAGIRQGAAWPCWPDVISKDAFDEEESMTIWYHIIWRGWSCWPSYLVIRKFVIMRQ